MYAKIQNATLFKKLFVNYLVPMNRTLGIKLKAMEENETVMTMKGRRKITNYGGSIHGGAIMALAETAHGTQFQCAFDRSPTNQSSPQPHRHHAGTDG